MPDLTVSKTNINNSALFSIARAHIKETKRLIKSALAKTVSSILVLLVLYLVVSLSIFSLISVRLC